MGKENTARRKSRSFAATFFDLILSASVVAGCGYGLKMVSDRTVIVGSCPYYQEDTNDTEIEEPDPNKIIFENSTVSSKDIFKGELILVNEDHEYFHNDEIEEHLVSVNEKNTENDITFFSGVDNFDSYGEMKILDTIYEPMVEMAEDFYEKTQLTDIVIYGGYRTTEFQQALYDSDLEVTGEETSSRVAKAGYSEHETGLAFDFSKLPEYDYDGEGEYSWFTENCFRYGFILRYPENKQDITKIQYEPWHFRYVGKAHAYYIMKNNICLEEYIELLRNNYSYSSGQFLEFADESGQEYSVFFVPADSGEENTSVPVPTGLKYDISGNNVDGFIVTVYKEKDSAPAPEPETEPDSEEETTEELSEDIIVENM